ncbi:unnamed protein product, partial [Prorocentrum cordatum]
EPAHSTRPARCGCSRPCREPARREAAARLRAAPVAPSAAAGTSCAPPRAGRSRPAAPRRRPLPCSPLPGSLGHPRGGARR